MNKEWDAICKELMRYDAEAFLNLFDKEAKYIGMYEGELQVLEQVESGQVKVVKLRMDHVIRVLIDGQEELIHLEWQTRNDLSMPVRLLDYNISGWKQHGRTFRPRVLHLLRDGKIPASPLIGCSGTCQVHRFDFKSIDIGILQAQWLWDQGVDAFLPLLPLTKGGLEQAWVERVLDELHQANRDKLEMLAYTFAVYAFSHYQKKVPQWLMRRLEPMEEKIFADIPFLRRIVDKENARERAAGRAEGIEQGRAEGMEKGMEQGLKAARGMLVQAVQMRAPNLVVLANQRALCINEPEPLMSLALYIATAKTVKEVRRLLEQ